MASERVFGAIPGVPVGANFADRAALASAGVHRPPIAGIAGGEDEGAESIVLSGGYEDDEDYGEVVVYTGQGGNDARTGKQVADQELKLGNLALARNVAKGLPVRVTRGASLESAYAPQSGYRYDGLYVVEDFWHQPGRSGFRVFRYRLRRDDPTPSPWPAQEPRLPAPKPARREVTVSRIIRDTQASKSVKELHGHRCQVCGLRLETPAGSYAEGAHIRPLGRPHDGPDVIENILCLCPNHHVLFDLGAFTVRDDFGLVGVEGVLRMTSGHPVGIDYLRYHRERYGS